MKEKTQEKRPLFKGAESGRAFRLAETITSRPGQVASLTFWRSGADSAAIFAFAAGEGISKEVLEEDRLYALLEGEMTAETEGKKQALRAGDCILVPAGAAHSLDAVTACKMFILTVG